MKQDLRVIKTKKSIYEALLKIMEKKTFENIKVSEICEVALINRSTFYAHFEDKYTLINSFISDLKNELVSELQKNNNISSFKEYYMELIKLLLDHIFEQKNIYRTIAINNRNSIIMDMIYDTLKEDIAAHLKQDTKNKKIKVPSEFISNFYLGAIVNTGLNWIENPNKYQKEEIIEYFNILIPNSLEGEK